jgi:hypothetical protein
VANTYYSTDGSYPSIPYRGPITLNKVSPSIVIKYYSIDNVGNKETVGIASPAQHNYPPATARPPAAVM